MQTDTPTSHSLLIGYLLWLFGFLGVHRFYYGRPFTGTLYFFTLGLFFVGWLVDLFLIPGMNRTADLRFRQGYFDYTLGWLLLVFLGFFGIHRMYLEKWFTGLLYLFTAGLFGFGYLYDLWTLNDQIALGNSVKSAAGEQRGG